MSCLPGVIFDRELGSGAQGTVRTARVVSDNVVGPIGGTWAAGVVAVKTWDDTDAGHETGRESILSMQSIPGALMALLVSGNMVMPFKCVSGPVPAVVMPVGVRLSNRDWRHVLALVENMTEATAVVHMDVKAANMMWHKGAVKFIDHEALCVAGRAVAGLPSYAPYAWQDWVPNHIELPATRAHNPEQFNLAYAAAYDRIIDTVRQDRSSGLALMLWGALCTAVTMTTQVGNPTLTPELIEELDCPLATRMYMTMNAHFESSALGKTMHTFRL